MKKKQKKVVFIATFLSFVILLLAFIVRADGQETLQIAGKERAVNPDGVLSKEESAAEMAVLLDYIVITETPVPTPTRTSTPKPTITPVFVRVTSDELNNLFKKYSQEYSTSEELLKKIAYCESKFNSQASNGIYGGLFQFTEGSWRSARKRMNMDQNPELRFHPEEAVRTAAFKIATGGVGIWPNCSR